MTRLAQTGIDEWTVVFDGSPTHRERLVTAIATARAALASAIDGGYRTTSVQCAVADLEGALRCIDWEIEEARIRAATEAAGEP